LTIGNDGLLFPGEAFTVIYSIRSNPILFANLTQAVESQVLAEALPVDVLGNPIVNPFDITGLTYTIIEDISDSGDNPESDNPNQPGDDGTGNTDDGTPVTLPSIVRLYSEIISVESAQSEVQGNKDATFEIQVCNIGSKPINNIVLKNNLTNQLGSGFVGVKSISTANTSGFTSNSNYLGYGPNDEIVLSNGLLNENICLTVVLEVEIDLNNLPETALSQVNVEALDIDGKLLTDKSDDLTDFDNNNEIDNDTGGTNDPTIFPEIADVGIALNIYDVTPASDPNDFNATFQIIVENTGNATLNHVDVMNDLNSITALGCAFQTDEALQVQLLPGTPNITVAPGINPNFNVGNTAVSMLDNSGTVEFNPSEQFIIILGVVFNPFGCTEDFINQASVTASNNSDATTDLSDSGSNPDGFNAGSPGDTGGYDDATPFSLPGSIQITSIIDAYEPTLNGTPGNYDVTYLYEVCNLGNVDLSQFVLEQNFASQYGNAFKGISSSLTISESGVINNASNPPMLNNNYNGTSTNQILTNSDGTLSSNECFTVTVTAEVDVSESPSSGLFSQAVVSATDANLIETFDASDDNTLNGFDTGGSNDPSKLNIGRIGLAKSFHSIEPASTLGNYFVSSDIKIRNIGSSDLTNISLFEDTDGLLNNAFVSIIEMPEVIASSAVELPTLFSVFPNFIYNGSDGKLQPTEEIIIRYTVEVNSANLDAPQLLQAIVEASALNANDTNGNTVEDFSDSGSDPLGSNPNAPGDNGNGGLNDATPLEISKQESGYRLLSMPELLPNGNYSAHFEIRVKNIGNVDLTNIEIENDLFNQLNCAYVGLIENPQIVAFNKCSC